MLEHPLQLLMVDDDTFLLEVVSEELSDRGHQVATISQPETVIDYLNSHSVDLMLLDLKMPNLNGLSLLAEIEQQHPALPVIILTGHGDIGSASTAMRHGAIGYLQKPVLMERLEEEIHLAIQKRGTAKARHTNNTNPEAIILQQLKGVLCNHCTTVSNSDAGPLPLLSTDEYHRRVILHYQHEMTETELARRLSFSRDKLWRVRKRLGIPRK